MKEISTAISYQEDKHTRSAIFNTIVSGNYCVLKWENTQCKVENGIQSNTDFFFSVLKFLAVESISCRKFRNTVEKEELIDLLLMH